MRMDKYGLKRPECIADVIGLLIEQGLIRKSMSYLNEECSASDTRRRQTAKTETQFGRGSVKADL